MLFDLGWSEILLIGIVALVFIGPKDLPKAMRLAGYWVRKARTLSREFQSSIDQMIREAELDDMRQQLKKASEFDLDREFHNTIDPTGSLNESMKPPELPNFSSVEGLPSPAVGGGVERAPDAAAAREPAAGDQGREPAGGDPAAAKPGSEPAPGPGAPAVGKPPLPAADPSGAGHDPVATAGEIVPPRS